MAGALRGRPDGKLVNITLSNGFPVLCSILHGDTSGLRRCVKCGYFPEEVYVDARCKTYCGRCFHALTDDRSTQKTKKTHKQQEVDINFAFNFRLHEMTLECPMCSKPTEYEKIKQHIAELHSDSLGQEAQHSLRKNQVPQTRSSTSVEDFSARTGGQGRSRLVTSPSSHRRQSEAIEKKREVELKQHKAQLGHGGKPLISPNPQDCGYGKVADMDTDMLTDDNDSDTSLAETHPGSRIEVKHCEEIVKCPYCITPLEASELEEHKKNCNEAPVPCHVCNESITVVSYEKHMEIHHEEQRKVEAQKASEDGVVARKGIERRLEKFENKPTTDGEITKRMQSLLTENKRLNEGNGSQKKLFDAIAGSPQEKGRGLEDARQSTQNKPVETSMTEPTHEAEDVEMKKRKEVAELKDRIKELEDRLEKLERPLQALIERLSQEQRHKRLPTSTDPLKQ